MGKGKSPRDLGVGFILALPQVIIIRKSIFLLSPEAWDELDVVIESKKRSFRVVKREYL